MNHPDDIAEVDAFIARMTQPNGAMAKRIRAAILKDLARARAKKESV